MASKIRDTLARLHGTEAALDRSTAKVAGDRYLSDLAKKEVRDANREALRASVADAAQSIFGDGGIYWTERETLQGKLREARDKADTLDPVRLGNTYQRVGSMVQQAQTPQELAEWYSTSADSYERRALQDMGAETIANRWRNHEAVGGLVGTLKRDRAQALATPELQAIEGRLRALDLDAVDAHDELSRYNADLGSDNPFSLDGAARVLQSVKIETRLESASDVNAPSTITISKVTDAGGVYWKNGAPEA